MTPEQVCDRIKERRESLQYTVTALARRARVARKSVRSIEHPETAKRMLPSTVQALLRGLLFTQADLIDFCELWPWIDSMYWEKQQ